MLWSHLCLSTCWSCSPSSDAATSCISQIDVSKLSFREEILPCSLRSLLTSSYRRSSDSALLYNQIIGGETSLKRFPIMAGMEIAFTANVRTALQAFNYVK
jgi:hypothetical protein